ncbi:MAG: META domain-containing protein [Mangrovicoccus sp.]
MRFYATLSLMVAAGFAAGDAGAAEAVSPFANPDAEWHLVSLNGAALEGEANLVFPEPGRMAGLAICNRFSGGMDWSAGSVKIGPLISTKMACPDMSGEMAVLAVLNDAERLEITGDQLVITNTAGDILVYKLASH